MSVLTDAYEARYSVQRVVELTNPGDPNATTKNATKLAAAGTDTEARFPVEVGVAFDETDARHVQAAIGGVHAFLHIYLDGGAGPKMLKAWIADHLKPLSLVTGRDRIAPSSTSNLRPSTPRAVKPGFDIGAFDGMALDNPAGSDSYSADTTQSG